MSDENAAENAETTTGATAPAADDQTPPAQETDWVAEARKWEARAKENYEKAQRLDEIEEQAKTEAQKQAERLAAAEAELDTFRQRDRVTAWAKEITKDSPIPADALRGTTREELEAHHEQLVALIPQAPRGPVIPTQGKTPASRAGELSADDWLRELARS